MQQTTLAPLKVKYHSEPYNKCDSKQQWIRITDGCPNQCEYCYAPDVLQYHGIPQITRNSVKIMDMNPLAVNSNYLYELPQKLNRKVIHYEMICGFDYRGMSLEIAKQIHLMRFGRFNRKGQWKRGVRIAWDFGLNLKPQIEMAVALLMNAGFKPKQIEIFMICDWKISCDEVWEKLITILNWGCMVNDCWFDNVKPPHYQCNYWDIYECKALREVCRKGNQLITFNGHDPEIKRGATVS